LKILALLSYDNIGLSTESDGHC